MIWHSAADFFAMGGYGLFVWGTYGVALVLMVAEPLLARRRRLLALADASDARHVPASESALSDG
ncbi:MAG: heme exporter protein CcmD [Rubrivivax sp.]